MENFKKIGKKVRTNLEQYTLEIMNIEHLWSNFSGSKEE